jgi:hypothetical protein
MKTLSAKQIIITIVIGYLITSYVNKEFNPFNLTMSARILQCLFIGTSLLIQLGIKNNS